MGTQTLRYGDEIFTDVPEGAEVSTSAAGNYRHMTALADDAKRQGLLEVSKAFLALRDAMSAGLGRDPSTPEGRALGKAGFELSALLRKVKYVPSKDMRKPSCLPCTVEQPWSPNP